MKWEDSTWEMFDNLLIKINNRKNFVLNEVKSLHPSTIKYKTYWARHTKRCIEGLWSPDDETIHLDINEDIPNDLVTNKWRWCPGNLYFYCNFGTMTLKEKGASKASSKTLSRPFLRDIDWDLSYNFMECRGFSGFKEDEEFTCERNVYLYFIEGRLDVDVTKWGLKKDGSPKTYIPAREYLRKLHPRPFGLALWENEAKNFFILGTRDFGKSYYVSQAILLPLYLFDDAKEYTEHTIKNPNKVDMVVGASIASKSTEMLSKFTMGLNKLPGAWGEGTSEYEPCPFFKNHIGNLQVGKVPFQHEYEVKVGNNTAKKGSLSSIKHVTYTIANPEAGAGSRASVSIIEEVGLMENILAVHSSNDAIMRNDGDEKFGTEVYIGTGGNIEKIRECEQIFNNPDDYKCLSFDNVLEQTSNKIGYFMPTIFAAMRFKDDNGNTDVKKAFEYRYKLREELKKRASPVPLASEMMNFPMFPSEMFLKGDNHKFPVVQIRERIGDIIARPHQYKNNFYYGDLVFDVDGKLRYKACSPLRAIEEYPIKDNKEKPGCCIIYKMPIKDSLGNIPSGRYILGTDTYDDDESNTTSLGSCFVFDLWTDEFVAEFTGRPDTETFYETTRKLTLFYGAIGYHLYEQNKKGLYSYYNKKNSIHYLADTPSYLAQTHNIKISSEGNKKKGVNMINKELVNHGVLLQSDWIKEQNEEGEFINLQSIRSLGYLRECLYYSQASGNYDRISAINMIFMLREEMIKYVDKRKEKAKKESDVNGGDNSTKGFFERYSLTKRKKQLF